MIRKIHIENFRSIRSEALPLGKITVLTGANNSGKSSILYGLMVLQDFVFNPNQTLEELFALPFINLGGFSEVKSKVKDSISIPDFIKLGVTIDTEKLEVEQIQYELTLSKGHTSIKMNSLSGPFKFNASLDIGLPYPGNMEEMFEAIGTDGNQFAKFSWNGFHVNMLESNLNRINQELPKVVNSPVEAISSIDFIPIKRGFTKPYYNLVPMTGIINSEEEIATMLKAQSRVFHYVDKVNKFLEKIADRVIELPSNGTPGLFSLLSKNTKTGQKNFLVNEGSGTNQLVTILAKTFQYNKTLICIDEPEIHLHPGMVRKLAKAFVEIVSDAGEPQFLISTHSEHLVQALLASVAKEQIKPDDLKIYHLTAKENGTHIESQQVNEKGQVEGGLSHFYEAELSELKSMFKLVD